MTRLEIGPGDHPVEGDDWMRVGIEDGPHVDVYPIDWGDGLPFFPDETFDEVFASHVLEHVHWTRTQAAVNEVFRVLKPGGWFEVWVPDFRYLVDCYLKRDCGDDWRHENPNNDPMVWLNGRLFTYGPWPNVHQAVFDGASLLMHFGHAGFVRSEKIKQRTRGFNHGPIEMGFRTKKP